MMTNETNILLQSTNEKIKFLENLVDLKQIKILLEDINTNQVKILNYFKRFEDDGK